LRQAPGPHNPLGRIKFSFANRYGVYLHGTPTDSAFGRAARTLSHGCVRVEDEVALAQFALSSDPSWTRERLLELLRTAWEHRLALPQPVAVHLLYFTATADAEGNPTFIADPYEWDPPLLAALDRGTTPLPPSP
jgi:murein L,D-transpeptidase YcbB/YkuD